MHPCAPTDEMEWSDWEELGNLMTPCHVGHSMNLNSKPVPRAKTFDAYLAALSAPQRAALEKLRKALRSAAPKAEECISYGVPAFRLHGKFLVALGAAANHCSFYPGS